MVSIQENLILPSNNDISLIKQELCRSWSEMALAINALIQGRLYARYSAAGAPTDGANVVGDLVYNSSPTEAGSEGSKYTIMGWVCTEAGTPGTWQAIRTLTGN